MRVTTAVASQAHAQRQLGGPGPLLPLEMSVLAREHTLARLRLCFLPIDLPCRSGDGGAE